MKHVVEAEDAKGRSLRSENYTLSRQPGLTLFSLSFLPYADRDDVTQEDREWQTEPVEFWASDKETAYKTLIDYLKVFHSYGLNEYSDTDDPLEKSEIVDWYNHYYALDLFTIAPGASKLETMQAYVNHFYHLRYVLKKMCQLVASVKDVISIVSGKNDYYALVEE